MPIITSAGVVEQPPVLVPSIGYISATYYDPAGGVWPLTSRQLGWYTLADGVSGLGAAPRELTTDPHPRGGSRLRHAQPLSRAIVWPLHVYGDTHLEFVDRWRSLARAFARTLREGPGVLEIARPDGGRRRIDVYYQDGFDGQGSRNASSSTYDSAIITLYCEDPFWYDPTPRVVHRESGSGEDYLQPYPSVSSSQVLGATTVTNPGDEQVWPEWTITGPASLVTFTRSDTGDEFVLDPSLVSGSLLATEQVVVTTDPPRVRKLTAEVQTVDLGAASAGSVTIQFDGKTTGSIAYDADAATVQAALEALPNVEPGDVTVSGGPLPAAVTLSFAGQYLGVDVPEVTVTPTGLTGGTVTVTTVTEGGTANWVGALNWPSAVLWPLDPGDNDVVFQLDGAGTGSAVDLSFNPRYETA
ncbi:phage tail domain-containing protein [Streptomyces sp. CC228A]|uniref:phage tail domain-containing protein n=1 Tax=Streptomyces sp. CC228A TaxID=2898186 RepID=UPI001F452B04|nr:phage tail domain-containing protein [Streptomyces sp. CC228A]